MGMRVTHKYAWDVKPPQNSKTSYGLWQSLSFKMTRIVTRTYTLPEIRDNKREKHFCIYFTNDKRNLQDEVERQQGDCK